MPQIKLTQTLIHKLDVPEGRRKVDYFDTEQKGLMLEVREQGRTFSLRYQDNRGKVKQKKLADATVIKLADARKLAQESLAAIAMGQDPFAAKKELRDVPKFSDFVADSYMPYIKTYKKSWDTDECLLRNHILPAIGRLHLDEIKGHHFVKLFHHHKATHKPASTNRIIILCRYIFNLAIKWEIPGLIKNPTKGIDLLPENNRLERYITPEETKRLFKALDGSQNKQLKNIVAMLLLTGARKGEVLGAKWTDFDFDRRIWTIQYNKTGKPRYVPISDGVLALLETMPKLEDCPWVFPNLNTNQPYKSIFTAWYTARKEAGLEELRIHDLRHSFASILINNGRSIYEVQKILGHTQITTTQRYAHLSQESLISAANTAASYIPMPNTPLAIEAKN